MKTILVYVNATGELNDELTYFLTYKSDNVRMIIYSEIQIGDSGFKENFCRELDAQVGYDQAWQMMLVDDRRLESSCDGLFGPNYDLWEIVDIFKYKAGGRFFLKSVPTVILMLTTVLGPANVNGTVDLKDHICFCPVRHFYFNFFRENGEAYKKMEISFAIMLSVLGRGEISGSNYRLTGVYQLVIEWDEDLLWKYLKDECEEYEKQITELENGFPDENENFKMPVYKNITFVETQSTKSHSRGYKKKDGRSFKEEFDKLQKEMEEKVDEEFERIKMTHFFEDRYEWDVENIKRTKEKYEQGLAQLYKQGFRSPEDRENKINMLDRECKDVGILSMFPYIAQVIGLVCCSSIFLGIISLPDIPNILFILFIPFIFIACLVCSIFIRSYDPRSAIRRYKIEELGREESRMRYRIDKELAYTSKYRQMYYEYNNVIKWQRGQREKRESNLRIRRGLEIRFNCTRRLCGIVGAMNVRKKGKNLSGNISGYWDSEGNSFVYPFIKEFRKILKGKE